MSLPRRALLACSAAALLLAVSPLVAPSHAAVEDPPAPPAARTVLLVRHAEKDAAAQDARDPGLSEAGAARAEALARLLGRSGAVHLFASEYHRTQDTLRPLGLAAHAEVAVVSAGKPDELLARLDALPAGSVAVVCGHSNTLPALAERLGVRLADLVDVRGTPMLDDAAYDRLFVVTRPAHGPAALLELAYGAPSGAAASSGR